MPWVGLGFMTLQQMVMVTGPGGVTLYRLKSKCGCGADFEFLLPYDKRAPELAVAMGQISEHWLTHMK